MPDLPDVDLFISYSRDDDQQGYISEIVNRIRTGYREFTGGEELNLFFAKTEPADLDERRQGALEAISSSHRLLVCLSPNYLQSEYCSWEFEQFLKPKTAAVPSEETIRSVYFVEVLPQSDKGFEQRAAEWVTELQRQHRFDFRPWFDEGAAPASIYDIWLRFHLMQRLIEIERVEREQRERERILKERLAEEQRRLAEEERIEKKRLAEEQKRLAAEERWRREHPWSALW